jgi:hypothetical protein
MVIGPFITFRLNPLASPRKPSVTIKWRSVDLMSMNVMRKDRQMVVHQCFKVSRENDVRSTMPQI